MIFTRFFTLTLYKLTLPTISVKILISANSKLKNLNLLNAILVLKNLGKKYFSTWILACFAFIVSSDSPGIARITSCFFFPLDLSLSEAMTFEHLPLYYLKLVAQ